MKKVITVLVACMVILIMFTCCQDTDEAISVRREMVDVGYVNVGDTVKTSFIFRNNKTEQIAINFLPECDCTTVSAESIKIEPHRSGSIEVKVAVETKGEFSKYVYVQAAGGDEFFTVSIKGRGK